MEKVLECLLKCLSFWNGRELHMEWCTNTMVREYLGMEDGGICCRRWLLLSNFTINTSTSVLEIIAAPHSMIIARCTFAAINYHMLAQKFSCVFKNIYLFAHLIFARRLSTNREGEIIELSIISPAQRYSTYDADTSSFSPN